MTPEPVCRYHETLRWLRWMASEQLRNSAYQGVQRAGAEMISAIDKALAKPCGCHGEYEKALRKNTQQRGKLCTCGRKARAKGKCSRCYIRSWRENKVKVQPTKWVQ